MSIKRVVHIYAGARHACALLDDGTASCWGANPNGELGAGISNAYSPMPVTVQESGTIQSLALGGAHSCAIVAAGGVQCWGDEEHGQLGNGVSGAGQHSTTPVTVNAEGTLVATAIALGKSHTCALFTDHSVWCWGRNDKAQLGDGPTNDSSVPVPVMNAPTKLTRLVAGDEFTCGWSPGGAAWCWGAPDHGELADMTTANLMSATNIPELAGATLLAVGSDFGCATLGSPPQLECWGANDHVQLGQGGGTDMTAHPTPKPTVTPFVMPDTFDASHVESSHACAVKDGLISCWGENAHGEVGDGTTADRATPARVLWQ